jgi:hypothetical protein
MKVETIDTAIAATSSKATYTGSGMILSGWLFSSEFAVLIGIVIGIAGFLVNWYYKHKIASAEIKFRLDELHLKHEQAEREKIEHSFKMRSMKVRCDDHKDCDHHNNICLKLNE